MKTAITLLAIVLFILSSVSFSHSQTLPIIIEPYNVPSNVVDEIDSIEIVNIYDGAGLEVIYHHKYKIYPKDFNQMVEISYSRIYSYVQDDTITIQHKIWRCDPNYPFHLTKEDFTPQYVPAENAVIWDQEKVFLYQDQEKGFRVIDENTFKVYPIYK